MAFTERKFHSDGNQDKQINWDIEMSKESPSRKGLRKGDIVRVRRSSGVVEDDWKIEGYDNQTGEIIVTKAEGNEDLKKKLPSAEIFNLNRDAKTFDEWLDIWGKVGGDMTDYSFKQDYLNGDIKMPAAYAWKILKGGRVFLDKQPSPKEVFESYLSHH